jgi:hypothetical protein
MMILSHMSIAALGSTFFTNLFSGAETDPRGLAAGRGICNRRRDFALHIRFLACRFIRDGGGQGSRGTSNGSLTALEAGQQRNAKEACRQ